MQKNKLRNAGKASYEMRKRSDERSLLFVIGVLCFIDARKADDRGFPYTESLPVSALN